MPEIARLDGRSSAIELELVEKEATPEPLLKLGIELHLASVSLSNTTSILEKFGVVRARSTVHNWVQKANLQPPGGRQPEQVALDETVIQINNQRFWLYAAVDPATNGFLHLSLYVTRTQALTERFLRDLRQKHDVDDPVFLVDSAPWLHAALHRHGLRFRAVTHGQRNAVERVFKEVKRRTNQFANHFRNAHPTTVENWLRAFAYCWNRLI